MRNDLGMERTAGLTLRWTRAAFLAAVAMLTGTVAHVSAGGYLPGTTALVWLFLVCVATSASLLGRPASPLRVAAMLMVGQTFFHAALTALSGHHGDPSLTASPAGSAPALSTAPVPMVGGEGRRVGSLYDQFYPGRTPAPAVGFEVPAPLQHLLADFTGPHALMAIAHLVAAAVLGLWIAHGERAVWVVLSAGADVAQHRIAALARHGLAAAGSIRATVSLLLAQELFVRRWHGPPVWKLGGPPREQVLANLVIRRGPPTLLAA